MRFCHIGHGSVPIPPVGWGAVESLIWNYKQCIEAFGHSCDIVNLLNKNSFIAAVETLKPDVLHVHKEEYFAAAQTLGIKVVILCSHLPKVFHPEHGPRAATLFRGEC